MAVFSVALLEGEKCIIPECHRRRYKDGTITHPYCSRSHAEEGKRRGIIRKYMKCFYSNFFREVCKNQCSIKETNNRMQ